MNFDTFAIPDQEADSSTLINAFWEGDERLGFIE
jgi:hypothetical protein